MRKYKRKVFFNALWKNLRGRVNLIQVVVGPRQVGKTTLALQIMDEWKDPKIYDSADSPDIPILRSIKKPKAFYYLLLSYS